LKKGVFASFKDLYDHNVSVQIKKNADDAENVVKNALEETRSDIKLGEVRFDHVACVGCGTCGIIGPKETVIFGPERRGHGVRFKYG
jgi:ferredoxin-like protein FixX